MKRRTILSLKLFISVFVITILHIAPCFANEQNADINNNLHYRLENNTAIITGYSGDEKVLIIPCKVEDHDVVSIDEKAFMNSNNIWVIVLPQTVTEIGDYAFHKSSIRSIVLSDSLKRIGEGAFLDSHLTSIYLPSSITEIGNFLFSGCTSLHSVKIDSKISTIPTRTFFECICLNDVELPESIQIIEEEAFYFCTKLRFINIPESILHIDYSAFYDCVELLDHPFLKDYIVTGDDDECDIEYVI